jgi:hypothetical protein
LIEESQIVCHEGDQPDLVTDLLDANILAGKDTAEVDFAPADADTTTGGDRDSSIVEGIFQLADAAVGSLRGPVELGRVTHAEGLVRALTVVDLHEGLELASLLKQVLRRRLGRFLLQGEVHPFMPAVLLRVAGLDALDLDPQAQPPHRQL